MITNMVHSARLELPIIVAQFTELPLISRNYYNLSHSFNSPKFLFRVDINK